MKVLQIVYSGLGGVGAVAFSIVEGQTNNKYKNIFLFVGIEKLLKDYKSRCKKLKINYVYARKKKYIINLKSLFKITFSINPDVIISHDFLTLPFFIFSKIKNKKLIFVHHTPDKTKNFINWLQYIFSGFLCDKIVLVSRRKRSDFMFKLNKKLFNKKVVIIQNGINTQKFSK